MKKVLFILSIALISAVSVNAQVFDFSKLRTYTGNSELNYNVSQFRVLNHKFEKEQLKHLKKSGKLTGKEYRSIVSKDLEDSTSTDSTSTDSTYTDMNIVSYYLSVFADYLDTATVVQSLEAALNTSYQVNDYFYFSPAVSMKVFGISNGSLVSVPSLSLGYGGFWKPDHILGMSTENWDVDYVLGAALYGSAGLQIKTNNTQFSYGLNPTLLFMGHVGVGYYWSNTQNMWTLSYVISK